MSRSAIAKWESDGGVPEIINLEIISGKKVNIDIAMKEGIISGFFDERSDDYMNVTISGIDESMVNLEFGDALDIAMIAKIEEILTLRNRLQ